MNREHVEQEVVRLADAWATAELRGDAAFLESTLADDFVGIGPLGFMLTKQPPACATAKMLTTASRDFSRYTPTR